MADEEISTKVAAVSGAVMFSMDAPTQVSSVYVMALVDEIPPEPVGQENPSMLIVNRY